MVEPRQSAARADFHAALPLFLLPLLSLPLSWWLLARNRFALRSADAAERTWARRLAALVAVDTLLGLLIAVGLATGAIPKALRLQSGGDHPRVGILYDGSAKRSVRVRDLTQGDPAEKAGLRVGDVLEKLDGKPLEGPESLQARLREWRGGPVKLEVLRGAERLQLELTPAGVPLPKGEPVPPPPRPQREAISWVSLGAIFAAVVALAHRRRARSAAPVLLCSALALALPQLISVKLFEVLDGRGHPSAMAISLATSTGVLLVLAFGARALLVRLSAFAAEGEPWQVGRTALRGLLYCYSLGWRAGLFVPVLLAVLQRNLPASSSPLRLLRTLEQTDGALFLLAAVILAPVGEELLFRGVLLPWMSGFVGPRLALALSSAMFAVMHLSYGWPVVTIAVYGAVLGWARIRSRTLGAPILLHTAINGLTAAFALAAWR